MVKLGDILKIKHGYAFKGNFFTDEDTGQLVLTPGNFTLKGGFQETKKFTTEKDFPSEFILNSGDLIVTMTDLSKAIDTIGFSALVPNNADRKYLHNQRIGLVKVFNPEFDKAYIYWVMRTKEYQRTIANTSNGATVHHTSPDRIYKYWCKKFNLSTQRKIVSILSAYDSLIENNSKRIRLLERMAENLYKEWFVRFRFPGYENTEFVDGLPKGWSIKKYGEIAEIVAGGDCPCICSDIPTDDLCVPIYSNGITNEGLYGYTNKERISKPCITISARGTIGYVCLRTIPFVPIVRLLAVVPKNISVYYLFHYSRYNYMEGNGTSQQQLTKPMLQKRKILVPAESTLLKFDMIIENIYNKRRKLEKINNTLTRQRDLLLPRLMSGKLEVKA